MKFRLASLLVTFVVTSPVVAQEAKLSIIVRSVDSQDAVEHVRKTLKSVAGIKFSANEITAGEKPKYFTDPFVVEIADVSKTNVGALAAALAKAQRPRSVRKPLKTNLALYTADRISEESVMNLRAALRDVNGLEVDLPGSLGGFPNRGYFWVQFEDAGGAALADVLEAVKKAGIRVSTTKPK